MAEVQRAEVQLGVGADLSGLEQFLNGLAILPEAIAEVFAQLQASSLGNTAAFEARGQQLARALVAGFQAELAGLRVGGADGIAGALTREMLGASAGAAAYATQLRTVQAIIEDLRGRNLPQLTQPAFTTEGVRALQSIVGISDTASTAVRGLNAQMAELESRMARMQSFSLSIRQQERMLTTEARPDQGTRVITYNPTVRRQIEAAGLPVPDLNGPSVQRLLTNHGGVGGAINLSASGKNIAGLIDYIRDQQVFQVREQMALAARQSLALAPAPPGGALVPSSIRPYENFDEKIGRLNRIMDALDRVGQLGDISFRPTGEPVFTRTPTVLPSTTVPITSREIDDMRREAGRLAPQMNREYIEQVLANDRTYAQNRAAGTGVLFSSANPNGLDSSNFLPGTLPAPVMNRFLATGVIQRGFARHFSEEAIAALTGSAERPYGRAATDLQTSLPFTQDRLFSEMMAQRLGGHETAIAIEPLERQQETHARVVAQMQEELRVARQLQQLGRGPAQLALTTGGPAGGLPVPYRSMADQLQDMAYANARARAFAGVGGLPVYTRPEPPPLPRIPFNAEAAAARMAANDERLRAAGVDPAAFRARAEAISQHIPADRELTAATEQLTQAERRAFIALEELGATLYRASARLLGPAGGGVGAGPRQPFALGAGPERPLVAVDAAAAARRTEALRVFGRDFDPLALGMRPATTSVLGGIPYSVRGTGPLYAGAHSVSGIPIPGYAPPLGSGNGTPGNPFVVTSLGAGGGGHIPPYSTGYSPGGGPNDRRDGYPRFNTGKSDQSGRPFEDEEAEQRAARNRARARQREQDRINREEEERIARESNFTRGRGFRTDAEIHAERIAAQKAARDRIVDPEQTTFLQALRLSSQGIGTGGEHSFQRSFREGFFGRTGDIAEQLGQTAKFSVLYGGAYAALFRFTQALHQGFQGAVDFQESLVSLSFATGRTQQEVTNFAHQLGRTAAASGVDSNVGVALGAQAVGLFGLSGASLARQQQVGGAVDVATQLARVSGAKDPKTAASGILTQLAALARAFDIPLTDLRTVGDAAVTVGRTSGAAPADLLQAAAEIGQLGRNAGFGLNSTLAAVSSVKTSLAETPQAAAGQLTQILSRADQPALEAAMRSVGVNTFRTNLFQQIKQLSEMNQRGELSTEEMNQITAAFGRGRSGQAITALIRNFPQVEETAGNAANQPGALRKAFDAFNNNLGGRLAIFLSEIQRLFTAIASTGVLDVFAALLLTVTPLVSGLADLVEGFAGLPRYLRDTALAIAALYAVGGVSGARAAASGAGSLLTGGLVGRFLGRSGGASVGGGALSRFLGPVAGAMGLIELWNQLGPGGSARDGGGFSFGSLGKSILAGGGVGAGAGAIFGGIPAVPAAVVGAVTAGIGNAVSQLFFSGDGGPKVGEPGAAAAGKTPFQLGISKTPSAEDIAEAKRRGVTVASLMPGAKQEKDGPTKAADAARTAAANARARDIYMGNAAGRAGEALDNLPDRLGNAELGQYGLHIDPKTGKVARGPAPAPESKFPAAPEDPETAARRAYDAESKRLDAIDRARKAKISTEAQAFADFGLGTDVSTSIQELQKMGRTGPTIGRAYIEAAQSARGAGLLTGEALRNFISGAPAVAQIVSGDTTIQTGNPLSGAQAGLGLINKAIAEANAAKTPTADMAGLMLQRIQAQEAVNSAASNQAAARTQLAVSRFAPDNTAARLSAQAQGLRAQRGLTRDPAQQAQIDAQLNDIGFQQQANALSIRQAARTANADPRSQISQARANIENAKDALAQATRGTDAYYAALGNLRQAQIQLGEAELQHADTIRRLNSDLTNPVTQARLDVQAARDKLARDQRTGASADVIDADKLAIKQAQNNAEATAFNQRLQDAQTAEQLGRTSHAAYIRYLQSEHTRLSQIHNRTRQQQEQLDTIDLALKAANEQFQGQWNLGDIKVPTPYEMRRTVAGAIGATTTASTVNNTVYINGANFEKVVGWLKDNLGQQATQTRTITPRKV